MFEPREVISDHDELYRRLFSGHVNPDGTVNSAAFKYGGHPNNTISVDLARLTTPEESVRRANRRGFGLGVLQATRVRQLAFDVLHDPLPDNRSHAVIAGENDRKKCRELAGATAVLIEPGRFDLLFY